MKGCLGLIVAVLFIGIALAVLASIGNAVHAVTTAGGPDNSTGDQKVTDSGLYRQKASSSVSRASKLVGNFPTGQDTSDYETGLRHINNLHERIGNFTIYQVVSEGRAIREQQEAARVAEQKRVADAADASRRAEEANLFHGDPDCLVLDRRSLSTSSDDYVAYVEGRVKNTCDRDFSYVQVSINFYRSDGSLEDSGLANVNNLSSGDTWAFKTIQSGTGGGTWRVEKVTGF